MDLWYYGICLKKKCLIIILKKNCVFMKDVLVHDLDAEGQCTKYQIGNLEVVRLNLSQIIEIK